MNNYTVDLVKALGSSVTKMRLGEAPKPDVTWLPPLEPGQCTFFELKQSSRLGGSLLWWCTREQHPLNDHQLSCRSM